MNDGGLNFRGIQFPFVHIAVEICHVIIFSFVKQDTFFNYSIVLNTFRKHLYRFFFGFRKVE